MPVWVPNNSLVPYSNSGGIVPQFVLGILGGAGTGLTSRPPPPKGFLGWLVSKKKCLKKYKLPPMYSPDTGTGELLLNFVSI